jgi:hypothetical protein
MRNFREATRVFWTEWVWIPDYLVSVKDHAWEVLWGAGVIGIPFGILTLSWAPSRHALGYVIAAIVFVAGYQLWRDYHVRLQPKLDVGGEITMTDAGAGEKKTGEKIKRRYFQIPIKCATEGPVRDCRGQLLRVFRWANNRWELTHIAETLDLLWSFRDEPALKLEEGAPRRLNVFFVENTARAIVIVTEKNRVSLTVAPMDRFRLDIRVGGEDGLPIFISAEVTIGEQWNDLTKARLEIGKSES